MLKKENKLWEAEYSQETLLLEHQVLKKRVTEGE